MNHSIVLLEILVTAVSLKQFFEKTVNLFPISFLIPVFLNETYSTHFETKYKFMLDIFEVRCHFLKVRQFVVVSIFFIIMSNKCHFENLINKICLLENSEFAV